MTKKLRNTIIRRMKALVRVFEGTHVTLTYGGSSMRSSILSHYMMINRIGHTDLESLSDVNLVLMCGMFEFAFPSGDYGYTKEQNKAIESLGDAIAELKQSERSTAW